MISDILVISTIAAHEVVSVVTLTEGIGMPASIALVSAGLILGVSSAFIHKTLDYKAKIHEKIKIFAEAKLNSISGILSKAIKDANFSHDEYQLILKEVEHYRILKEQNQQKSKEVVDTITAEQREIILAEGQEQEKKDFLLHIAGTSVTSHTGATLATNSHHRICNGLSIANLNA